MWDISLCDLLPLGRKLHPSWPMWGRQVVGGIKGNKPAQSHRGLKRTIKSLNNDSYHCDSDSAGVYYCPKDDTWYEKAAAKARVYSERAHTSTEAQHFSDVAFFANVNPAFSHHCLKIRCIKRFMMQIHCGGITDIIFFWSFSQKCRLNCSGQMNHLSYN